MFMRQSRLFTKTKKEIPEDEKSKNAQLLIRAGFIDKLAAGVYSFLPLGLRVFKKIENIIREEMNAAGGQEILMPSLQPKLNWQKTGRWDSYDTLFKFTSFYSKTEYALGPTHEEVVSPLAKRFIVSYKDLPKYIFQIQNKFRDEKRAKSGLLRTREFFMKDLYSFHKNEKDMDEYYEKIKKIYEGIFKKVGIDKFTYLTFASGGTFSKYSHEFQTLTAAGEDTIHICDKCRIAINEEIINEQKKCPDCGNENLRKESAVEVGNIFKLKTKYSAPFELKYKDEKGEDCDVIMGCYGIGLTRLIGAIVEIYNDGKGIIWPESVAPFDKHLIVINSSKQAINGEIKKAAEKIYDNLQKRKIEVIYDDRDDKTAGEKFADADLMGMPERIVLSERTLAGENAEIKKRSGSETKLVKIKELLK